VSVIYATLERLETDSSRLADNKDNAGSPRLNIKTGGFPFKAVATAITLVIAGTILLQGHRSDESAGAQWLAPATTADHNVLDQTPDLQLTMVSAKEPPTAPLESTVPTGETPTEQSVVTPLPKPTDPVAVAGERRDARIEESPELDPIEEPSIVAEVKVATVDTPVTTPKTAPAEPEERNQIPASETVQWDGVDEVIEQARLALSRGRYQQALSTLESLDPVPEKRADFWLIKGSAHLGNGQYDLAEKGFTSAQALAPDNAQIAVQQAILNQEKGDHASALEILKGAAARHPNVPEVFLNLGYSQQALGAQQAAKHSFRTFLRMTENRSLYLEQRKVVKEWLAQVFSIQG